jgi:hypothetical protein
MNLGVRPNFAGEDVVIGSQTLLGRMALCVLGISLAVTPGLAAGDSDEAWAALVKGGHVAVIRHGNAPPGYGGDPPGSRSTTARRNETWTNKGAEKPELLASRFATTACA